jgi:glutamate synthase domain-containing protein 3
VAHTKGHRFIANGLGPDTSGVTIEVYGSSGDYLASGLDGAKVVVHGSGQDQLAQIMKAGKFIVHGDVGQTFMYAAKGGEVYVLGDAAGRPLINAVGKPRVIINGTCLDYLAESFMAGDALNGGGFVVLNGVRFDGQGQLQDLAEPYPGGNLFSLSSGGAIFVRDPRAQVREDQLNGGRLVPFREQHWSLILPMLEENERLFGIPVERLLTVEGDRRSPEEVYRAVIPSEHEALQPEEAWIKLAGEEI